MSNLVSIKRMSQAEKGLQDLRKLILTGAIAAGERLSEPVLAERLEISRTPLRSAMAQLVEEGLLERVTSGGCRVRQYTMGEVVDAIEIRGTMEGLAARLAAERGASSEQIQRAHKALATIDNAISDGTQIDFDAYIAGNAEFHEIVIGMSGSSVLAREIDRIYRLPLASPSAFLTGQEAVEEFRHSLFGAQRQHRAILDAISKREGARAEALGREHARLARENLEHVLGLDRDMTDKIPGLALIATG